MRYSRNNLAFSNDISRFAATVSALVRAGSFVQNAKDGKKNLVSGHKSEVLIVLSNSEVNHYF
jgi:hypothetical protein